MLNSWFSTANNLNDGNQGGDMFGGGMMEQTELLQAIRSQNMRLWCDSIRHHIHSLNDTSALYKSTIDMYSKELRAVEMTIVSYVVA